jgi:hypothetical protein
MYNIKFITLPVTSSHPLREELRLRAFKMRMWRESVSTGRLIHQHLHMHKTEVNTFKQDKIMVLLLDLKG